MHFNIRHRTRYRYSKPVLLGPQDLRFHPRDDGSQRITEYRLDIEPMPIGANDHIDLEGNRVTQVWFKEPTESFDITLTLGVETLRRNAFDYILAPEMVTLPIRHEHDTLCAQAYLDRIEVNDATTIFAAELSLSVGRNTLSFLDQLNQRLFSEFTHIHRDTGVPQTPAHTLESRQGACRDLAVLFVDCCRAEGIAARFASGYQRGNLQSKRRDLHAWPEVYLPGAGWRGYDPTHGEALADTHVTIAAAAHPRNTMPVSGAFSGKGAQSSLDFELSIQVQDQQSA